MRILGIVILFITISLGSFSIHNSKERQPMEKFNYSAAWAKVDSFAGQNLPESAMKVVNEIYEHAKKEENASQLVKAIIHILKFTEFKEEDAYIKNLNRLKQEAEKASFPEKPLLHSMLAQVYWIYYQNNRYIFSQRSETADFENDDISTWSLDKLVQETIDNYLKSLEYAEQSKQTKIDIFDEVLEGGNSLGRAYRPTLYDFLAHRAVDFFMSQEPDITRPAYAFTINSVEYLKDFNRFAELDIATKDTLAYKYHALKIFQQLIELHIDDDNQEALIDVDLKRLQFVHQYLTLNNKDELFLKALEELEEKTIKMPYSTMVTYNIASVWARKGSKYQPLQSDDHKWDKKKAWDICQKAIDRFPESAGAILSKNFQMDLKAKSISSTIEKVNVPETPFRALINYKNFTELYWKIIPVTREEVKAERARWIDNYNVDREKKFVEHFLPKSPTQSGHHSLTDDGDFQQHNVEIDLKGVPAGDYMVLFSTDKNFATSSNNISYAFTTISNISYVHRNLDDGKTEMIVLDRTTGKPIQNAAVQIYFNVYKTNRNKYVIEKGDTFMTNKEGSVVIPYQLRGSNDYYHQQFIAEITYGKDKIYTSDIDSDYYGYNGQIYQGKHRVNDPYTQTMFFLDRAIYRPGQTLYYKGLVYIREKNGSSIIPNQRFWVTFYDVNSQKVAEQEVTTNEYGTFSGTFVTPSAGLMGDMYLRNSDGSGSTHYFSVEEYKRPKFEVSFDPVKGSFKLGEIISTKGKATAYSGANIDGAKVKYRVVRTARFPYWWWCRHGFYPSSPEMEITNGFTETDESGRFTVDFKAIPDENVSKESNPVFSYKVYADVTDINGETHSNQTIVSVGYKSLVLGVQVRNLDKNDEPEKERKFSIQSTNLAGEFEPAKGEIKIWKLKTPDRAFRKRTWTQPDRHVMTKEAYYKLFPHDLYADENNYLKWEKDKETLSVSFNTGENKELAIKNITKWNAGKYLLEIKGKDKYGEEVKEVAYFDVNDSGSDKLTFPTVNYLNQNAFSYQPGETAKIDLGSSEKVDVLYDVEKDGKIIDRKRIQLDNKKQTIEIPIVEEYRGNVAFNYVFVKDNRLYSGTNTIYVDYTNKVLNIEFESFRDKLQPGEEETWKIKISGPKADKVAAEMVAGLYDASLDAFRANYWSGGFWYSNNNRLQWSSMNGFQNISFRGVDYQWNNYSHRSYSYPGYEYLNWFGVNIHYYYRNRGMWGGEIMEERNMMKSAAPRSAKRMAADEPVMEMDMEMSDDMALEEVVAVGYGEEKNESAQPIPDQDQEGTQGQDFGDVKIRKNFNETAFFYPHLMTDEEGSIIIKFTIPEALTRWKMLGFAHTKDLKSGYTTNELVTQKDLMVVPNQPRFFRENDKMFFSAKITSMTDEDLSGEARLEFFDALTMKSVDVQMKNTEKQKPFSVKAKQSTSLEWSIEIPEGLQALTYRIVAKAGNFSDGEEMTLPVVTNRMLVTETLPLPIRGKQTKEFRFDKLVDNTSTTLRNQRYTLEFTSNPAWYAVQALPYLIEYPYECTEQTFSRYYANSIASHIANSNPKIKHVFDTWATIQPDALLSNLEKNQELKSALLEETPWVLNAKDESQRKRNVALLFDLNRMGNEMERALKKIQEAQTGNGGFSWFKGLPEDMYITQYIITGMGHLDVLGVKTVREDQRTWNVILKALGYLDNKMHDRYRYLKAQAERGLLDLEKYKLGYTEIQYLYMRGYFKDVEIQNRHQEAFNYFLKQGEKYWQENSIYMQGMVALALHRFDKKEVTKTIIKSLKERALHSEEMGMYWKMNHGYFWYQAPIETQALMIEVFDEVAQDQEAVEDLKVWLLKQKQTQDWKTTKATSEACYALLRRGMDVLASDKIVEVTVGKELVDPTKREDTKVEAGTGYFKTAWTASEITPEMGKIKVKKTDEGVAWGAVYWQYFEQLDKITPAETPLSIKKQLFLEKNTERGPVITPVNEKNELTVGDLVKVWVEIRVDRDMEYVHMKDMRASGFEPVETLSTFKYQDGLYYYQSPRDLSMNFFIGWLPKGTYVFEYPLRVSQKGDFSNGVTTIQCMYAPEFSSHSEGIRVKMK